MTKPEYWDNKDIVWQSDNEDRSDTPDCYLLKFTDNPPCVKEDSDYKVMPIKRRGKKHTTFNKCRHIVKKRIEEGNNFGIIYRVNTDGRIHKLYDSRW